MKIIIIILGVVAAISLIGVISTSDLKNDTFDDLPSLQTTTSNDANIQDSNDESSVIFTYYDTETVANSLSARGLHLSTPVPITDHTISQYCTYYSEASSQFESVSYCTTSGITDANGITVGNFNLGGDTMNPIVALVVLDPVLPLDSGRNIDASLIIAGVIEGLVCDCWEEKRPGEFASVLEWMIAAESMLETLSDKTSLKSTINGLEDDITITLEVSIVPGGYQWSLVILQ